MKYHRYYLDNLYPLQDKFLNFFDKINAGRFYLTGGTALSRCYFQHRYSEDLDFFSIKELKDFRQSCRLILDAAQKQDFDLETEVVSDNFLRIFIKKEETVLKIDFVNEIVYHWGEFKEFPFFACVDNEINILANKITCVSRYEVKDIADIWILAKQLPFSWREIICIAEKKSPVDPIEISKIIGTLPQDELKLVKWASDTDIDDIFSDLKTIAKDILLGNNNTLMSSAANS